MKLIHQVVDVDAPSAKLWWALTDGAGMAGWWSTKVDAAASALGAVTNWTFAGDFNPTMEVTSIRPCTDIEWRCIGGHDPWKDNTFRFQLNALEVNRTRLRFWQDYAVELGDDDYGIYNFNWGYYLESLRLLCTTGTGKPFEAP